jgi:hypothetical protein
VRRRFASAAFGYTVKASHFPSREKATGAPAPGPPKPKPAGGSPMAKRFSAPSPMGRTTSSASPSLGAST